MSPANDAALPLAVQDPLPRRLLAWMHERFPLRNALFFGALYAAAVLYGRALTGGAAVLRPADGAGFVAVWCFFLLLRVLDEHKDYADDARHHPDRVLQRGLVTLRQLAAVGAVAAIVPLVVSVGLDGGFGRITALWLATLGWSLLMGREFFLGPWLRPRLMLYAASHMLVMPIAALWMAQIGAGDAVLPAAALRFGALALLSGFAFEVARKTRAPEDERPGVDSYTSRLGTGRAPLVLLALVAGTACALLWALAAPPLEVPLAALAPALALGVTGAAVPLLRFRRRPTRAAAARVELAAGLAMLLCYLGFILTLVAAEVVPW